MIDKLKQLIKAHSAKKKSTANEDNEISNATLLGLSSEEINSFRGALETEANRRYKEEQKLKVYKDANGVVLKDGDILFCLELYRLMEFGNGAYKEFAELPFYCVSIRSARAVGDYIKISSGENFDMGKFRNYISKFNNK